VPAYGDFVREQVAKLGRSHPLIKTQFYGEEIDAEGGMFPPARLAMMVGEHVELQSPEAGRIYAALIDVAGQDEGASLDETALENPKRDSTAFTAVEIDLSTLSDPLVKAPIYKVVSRRLWTGTNQVTLYAQLRALIEHWRAQHIVIDATGVGAGLSSFLDKAFPGKVLPFVFTQSSKSKLGWDFLGVIDTGRFKDYQILDCHAAQKSTGLLAMTELQALFLRQAENCQYEVMPGPGKILRWSVPDGFRDPETGELLHDDLLMSAALVAELDNIEWAVTGPALVVEREDPLSEMDREGF
jgi:hypothetical protein